MKLNNFRIRTRILFSFVIVILFILISSSVSIFTITTLNNGAKSMNEVNVYALTVLESIKSDFSGVRLNVRDVLLHPEKLDSVKNTNDELFFKIESQLTMYATELAYPGAEEADSIYAILDSIKQYQQNINLFYQDVEKNDLVQANTRISNMAKDANSLTTEISDAYNFTVTDTDRIYNESKSLSQKLLVTVIVIVIFIVVLSVILAIIISSSISKPIAQIVSIAENVSNGNLNVNINTDGKDEVAELPKIFNRMVSTINNLVASISTVSREININGDIDAKIDSNEYNGAYKEVVIGFHEVIEGFSKIS